VTLTTRGRIALALGILALVILFTAGTRDVCWNGTAYGSCEVGR
jgi:hypothetical protein